MTLTEQITARLDEWEAVARAATPGPWHVPRRGTGIDAGEYDMVIGPGPVDCMAYCYGGSSTIDGDRLDADQAHIALHDPAAVLALVAGLRAAVGLHFASTPDTSCDAETWAPDHYGAAVDPYWIRCGLTGRHDEHGDPGNTGCSWPLTAADQAAQAALPLSCDIDYHLWPCPTLLALAAALGLDAGGAE